MLNSKKAFYKIMDWIGKQGASTTNSISYGTQTTITPSRTGWLVAKGKVQTQQTLAPIIRIMQGTEVLAESAGLVTRDTTMATSCYVRKGETYSIAIFRAALENVTLY